MISIEKDEKFIENNLGLVHLCANKFRNRGIDYEELYSAGCEGILKAAKGFDETRGVKFSTYAVPVILGEIKRLFREGGTVKVSRSLKEMSLKVTRFRDRFTTQNGREPSILEIASSLELSSEDVVEALNVSAPPLSLTISGEDDTSEFDIPTPPPDKEIVTRLSIKQIISELEECDQKLITLRYFENKTQTEVAKILNMSQVQVSRKEKKLLLFMKSELLK